MYPTVHPGAGDTILFTGDTGTVSPTMIIGGAAIAGIITIITAVSITITIPITDITTCITKAESDDRIMRLTIPIDPTNAVMMIVECTEEEEFLTLLTRVCDQEDHPMINSGVAM